MTGERWTLLLTIARESVGSPRSRRAQPLNSWTSGSPKADHGLDGVMVLDIRDAVRGVCEAGA
ncbi:hypothetical protein [Streptomyces anulatus]|uniref:hypothetical protein n=1 Tax=Streptomyces anulatus TaxID=1892 RepID=UPI00364A17A7